MSIGENVRRIRKDQRYTQTEIARRCGVTPAAISAIEHGESMPSVPLLAKIARALEVTTDALIEEPAVPLVDAPEPGHPETLEEAIAENTRVHLESVQLLRELLARLGAGSANEPPEEIRKTAS